MLIIDFFTMYQVIIPTDMKIKDNTFCLNTFVVRLMSVDHQRTQGLGNIEALDILILIQFIKCFIFSVSIYNYTFQVVQFVQILKLNQ